MSEARIFEGGYRRYEGQRLGLAHATRAVWSHTLRRILGLGRPARSKILPVLSILLAYVPVIVFIGIAAFLKDLSRPFLPDYGFTYGFITLAIILFVVMVAPEALCPDRRSSVLSLYLATPLTRAHYLMAKAAAVATALLFVTLGPPLLYLIGLALQDAGPKGFTGFATTFGRILLAGFVLSAFYTALSVGIASCTDRRAIAGAATFFVPQAVNIALSIIVFALKAPEWLIGFTMNQGVFAFVVSLYGLKPFRESDTNVPMVALFAGVVFWTVSGGALAWWRYHKLQVTR